MVAKEFFQFHCGSLLLCNLHKVGIFPIDRDPPLQGEQGNQNLVPNLPGTDVEE